MNEKIRAEIEVLFQSAPATRRNYDLKEELFANSVERFNDLIADGVPEEEAYKIVINSIGDVNDLISENVEKNDRKIDLESEEKKNKEYAKLKAISAGLFILGVVVFFIFVALGQTLDTDINLALVGIIALLIIYIAPISLNVYVSTMRDNYKKKDESVVEEFREWSSDNKKEKSIRKSISSIIWLLVVIFYFIISFATGAWYITWIIFIIGACIESIISLLRGLNK